MKNLYIRTKSAGREESRRGRSPNTVVQRGRGRGDSAAQHGRGRGSSTSQGNTATQRGHVRGSSAARRGRRRGSSVVLTAMGVAPHK